jgi:hypothetical protein
MTNAFPINFYRCANRATDAVDAFQSTHLSVPRIVYFEESSSNGDMAAAAETTLILLLSERSLRDVGRHYIVLIH